MRRQDELLVSRTRVRSSFALLPLEGIPTSHLPEWPGAAVRVLAAPALGAEFCEYRFDLEQGQRGVHRADGSVEFFLYLLSGEMALVASGSEHLLTAGGYALLPPGCDFTASAVERTTALVVRKRFEPMPGRAAYEPLFGNEAAVRPEIYAGDSGARLQSLLPDDPAYDMAMNIFTFDSGHGLPVTETHVMEHGLYVLQGKGVYFLDDAWLEVQASDFVWMAPFCPQSYYAAGPVASKYIYYKNVNREIPL